MPTITEVAPDVYRICTYVSEVDLQFNQFLVKDHEPLLYHTGMKAIFPQLLETVGKILKPLTIRWTGLVILRRMNAVLSTTGWKRRPLPRQCVPLVVDRLQRFTVGSEIWPHLPQSLVRDRKDE